jgi:hypothetical protein
MYRSNSSPTDPHLRRVYSTARGPPLAKTPCPRSSSSRRRVTPKRRGCATFLDPRREEVKSQTGRGRRIGGRPAGLLLSRARKRDRSGLGARGIDPDLARAGSIRTWRARERNSRAREGAVEAKIADTKSTLRADIYAREDSVYQLGKYTKWIYQVVGEVFLCFCQNNKNTKWIYQVVGDALAKN